MSSHSIFDSILGGKFVKSLKLCFKVLINSILDSTLSNSLILDDDSIEKIGTHN